MKTFQSEPATQSDVALCLMVNQLSISTLPSAIRRSSIIINDVPAEFTIKADQHKLAAVLGGLLQTVISHTKNSSIRIYARLYESALQLRVKGNNRMNGPAFTSKLGKVQQMAQKIGGNVCVINGPDATTMVALSFIDEPMAA